MSDLDDDSEIEPDVDPELDPELDADLNKEVKDINLPKSLADKKLAQEFGDSDVDDDDDDDDGIIEQDDDMLPSDDDASSLSEDKPTEYNQTGNAEDTSMLSPINSDIDSEDEDYLQKFDMESTSDYVKKIHPECLTANSTEIEGLSVITRDKNNRILDDNHLTNPFLSKYERTRILGQRAKQLNGGCKPYIKVPKGIIDGYLIAELELKEKKNSRYNQGVRYLMVGLNIGNYRI